MNQQATNTSVTTFRRIASHFVLVILLVYIVGFAVTYFGYSLSGSGGISQRYLEGAFWGVIAAIVVGLLLLLSIMWGLHNLELALARLANGLTNPPLRVGRIGMDWALGSLYASVNTLNTRATNFVQATQQVGQVREQWLDQLRDAAAQEERNRLARDLHDSIKQQIFSIKASAATVQARWENDPEGARAALNDVRRSAQEAQVEMNALLQQLRPAPLEAVGLIASLHDQCEALGYRTGAHVVVELDELPPADRLPPGAQDTIFRIAQEALANIARHARANNVRVRLLPFSDTAGEAVWLEISDDGQGFSVQTTPSGMGTTNMTERARSLGGALYMDSAPGKGTILSVRIPLVPISMQEQEDETSTEVKVLLDRSLKVWSGVVVGFMFGLIFLILQEHLFAAFFSGWIGIELLIGVIVFPILASIGFSRSARFLNQAKLITRDPQAIVRRLRYEKLDVLYLMPYIAITGIPQVFSRIVPGQQGYYSAVVATLCLSVISAGFSFYWYRFSRDFLAHLSPGELAVEVQKFRRATILNRPLLIGFSLTICLLIVVTTIQLFFSTEDLNFGTTFGYAIFSGLIPRFWINAIRVDRLSERIANEGGVRS